MLVSKGIVVIKCRNKRSTNAGDDGGPVVVSEARDILHKRIVLKDETGSTANNTNLKSLSQVRRRRVSCYTLIRL